MTKKSKNVTVTLSEDVARWARVYAAEHDTSLSRILGGILRDKMESESAYGRSMGRFLSKDPKELRGEGESIPCREDLHER